MSTTDKQKQCFMSKLNTHGTDESVNKKCEFQA